MTESDFHVQMIEQMAKLNNNFCRPITEEVFKLESRILQLESQLNCDKTEKSKDSVDLITLCQICDEQEKRIKKLENQLVVSSEKVEKPRALKLTETKAPIKEG